MTQYYHVDTFAQANTTTALEFDNAMEPKTPVGDSAPGGSQLPTNRTEVEVKQATLADLLLSFVQCRV